jgi:hypothetical protein
MRQPNARELRTERIAIAKRVDAALKVRYGPMSERETARRLGINRSTWRRHLAGAAMPGEIVLRLIVAHRISWGHLLEGTGPMFR